MEQKKDLEVISRADKSTKNDNEGNELIYFFTKKVKMEKKYYISTNLMMKEH